MNPEVYIHIGPPKTATTSLQIALQAIACDGFLYGGTFQPRDRNEESLCKRLYRASATQNLGETEISRLRIDLRKAIEDSGILFLSEEMFLLEQDHASIVEKARRLRDILSGFRCRILISARPGKSALPSLYQEIFKSLPLKLQMDFTAFCRSQKAICYDYVKVCQILKAADFHDIVLIEFKYLTQGCVNLSWILDRHEYPEIKLDMKVHNAGVAEKGGSQRALPKVSLKSVGAIAPIRKSIAALHMRGWPGYRFLVGRLDAIVLTRSSKRDLVVPPDVSRRLDTSYEEAMKLHHQALAGRRAAPE